MASRSGEFGTSNYHNVYTWMSGLFVYRSPHKNLFLRFALHKLKTDRNYIVDTRFCLFSFSEVDNTCLSLIPVWYMVIIITIGII